MKRPEQRRVARYIFLLIVLELLVAGRRLGFVTDTQVTQQVAPEFRPPSMAASEMVFRPSETFSAQEGEFYRLSFYAARGTRQDLPLASRTFSATSTGQVGAPPSQPSQIRLYLLSRFNEKRLIGTVAVQEETAQPHEVLFRAPASGEQLLFEKQDPTDPHDFYFDSIRLSRLAVDSTEAMSRLAATQFGVDHGEPLFEHTDDGPLVFRWRKTKSMVGQVFQAKAGQLSSVSFRMQFHGANISGPFSLRLMEVEQVDGKYRSSSTVLAASQLGLDDMMRARDASSPLADVYRFPLRANLKANTFYFVGLDSSQAHLNLLNSIEFYGAQASQTGGAVMLDQGDSPKAAFGNLYLRLDGQVESAGPGLPPGARLEDIGTKYTYSYESPTEYAASAVAKEGDNQTAIYRFPLQYPFEQAVVRLETGTANYTVQLSTDGQNWREVPYDVDPLLPSNGTRRALVVSGDGQASTLYLRVQHLVSTAADGGVGAFGIRMMMIYAELKKGS